MTKLKDIKEMQKQTADEIREDMIRGAVDDLIKEMQSIDDAALISAVSRRIKVKVRLY